MEMKEIYRSNDYIFQEDAPIIVTSTALLKDEENQTVQAKFEFVNRSEKVLSAMVVQVGGKDVWGKESDVCTEHQYLDLSVEKGASFGQNAKVTLQDANIRTLSIRIVKLLFADGETLECSGDTKIYVGPETLSSYLNDEIAQKEFVKQTTSHAIYVPKQEEDFWICTCGSVNVNGESCYKCNSEYEKLATLLENKEALRENAILEKKREEARRKILQEKEEEKRKAEAEEWQRMQIEREEAIQSAKKKKIFLIVVPAVIVSFILSLILIVPALNYSNATKAFNSQRYEQAYQGFSGLGNYKDSVARASESKYQWACQLQENEEYYEAYCKFKELGGYGQSEDKKNATMVLWMAQALGSGESSEVDQFCSEVSVDSSNATLVYSTLVLYLEAHPTIDFWYDGYNITVEGENALKILGEVPSGHDDRESLLTIFQGFYNNESYETIIEENREAVKTCFGFGFVQDMVKQDESICAFLRGHWTSGSYYFTMDEEYFTQYNLPFVAEPAGTRYYDIESMIYRYEGENGEFKANVYRFEIVDYNKIYVYCYKNGRTYTMTR